MEEDEVAESPKKSPDKGKEKPAKGQAAKGRSKGNKDKEQGSGLVIFWEKWDLPDSLGRIKFPI